MDLAVLLAGVAGHVTGRFRRLVMEVVLWFWQIIGPPPLVIRSPGRSPLPACLRCHGGIHGTGVWSLLCSYSAEQSFLLGTRPEGGRHWDQPAEPVGGSRAAAQAQAAAQARDQKKMRVAGVRPGEEALLFIWVACVVQSACRRSGCGLHCPP